MNANNVRDLNQLIAKLEVVIREYGNMPVSVSVFQEHPTNTFGAHWEDRPLCSNIEIVETDGRKFLELAV